nr:ATP-grasp domain-containing protein [Kibdelosporangium sp. MJ126-NF4]
MRPVLMLFVGARGMGLADLIAPLAAVADVVVAAGEDALAARPDALDESLPLADVVLAADQAGLLEKCLHYAEHRGVDGALTFSEDQVEVTAAFAEQTGVPGQPTRTVSRFVDKHAQRQALADAGVPVPAFHLIRDAADVPAALAAVPLPAVLKPTRGSGGALVSIITEPGEVVDRLRTAGVSVPHVGGAVTADTCFILEQLLVGANRHDIEGFAPYVSVESLAVGGQYRHLAVTDRFPVAPPVLETGMMLPSGLPGDVRQRICDAAGEALRALEFEHGLAHTELMLTADGPVVIEVNARSGGALPYLFPLVGDFSLVEAAGRVALGELPVCPADFRGHAVFYAPQHPVGVRVRKVDGLGELRTLPGIRAVIPLTGAGTSTEHFRNTMMAAVIGSVATPQDAVTLWHKVMDGVHAEYDTIGER